MLMPLAQIDLHLPAAPVPRSLRTQFNEREMHDRALAFLPRQHYDNVLEIGCGRGTLGRRLSARADSYLGIDADGEALDAALAAPAPFGRMRFRQGRVPADFPEGRFDLVVLSGVLHGLTDDQIRALASRIGAVAPMADVVCLQQVTRDTEDAEALRPYALLAGALGWMLSASHVENVYRVDVFSTALNLLLVA